MWYSKERWRQEFAWIRWMDGKGKPCDEMSQQWSACSTRCSYLREDKSGVKLTCDVSRNNRNLLIKPKPGFFNVSKSGKNFSRISGTLHIQSVWTSLICLSPSLLEPFFSTRWCCPSKNICLRWFWYSIFFMVFIQKSGDDTSNTLLGVFLRNSAVTSRRDGMNLSLLRNLKTFWKWTGWSQQKRREPFNIYLIVTNKPVVDRLTLFNVELVGDYNVVIRHIREFRKILSHL